MDHCVQCVVLVKVIVLVCSFLSLDVCVWGGGGGGGLDFIQSSF